MINASNYCLRLMLFLNDDGSKRSEHDECNASDRRHICQGDFDGFFLSSSGTGTVTFTASAADVRTIALAFGTMLTAGFLATVCTIMAGPRTMLTALGRRN